MKKMNYEAPKAEVIELSVNKDFMQEIGGTQSYGSASGMP